MRADSVPIVQQPTFAQPDDLSMAGSIRRVRRDQRNEEEMEALIQLGFHWLQGYSEQTASRRLMERREHPSFSPAPMTCHKRLHQEPSVIAAWVLASSAMRSTL